MSIKQLLITSSFLLAITLLSQPALAQIVELKGFGDNPGQLNASYYSPDKQAPNNKNPTLVVLLHGCAQQGETLAQQSGLLGLAKQQQFALLMPQQGLENNIKRCFNWYSAADYTKGSGENLSIINMITTLKQQLGSEKVYIIGLSGGGAMASSLLVNYPNLFTAGAVVAGIPFPCADGLITAISCMKNGPSQTSAELVTLSKKLTPSQSIWPKLSVWTGDADNIVNPLNSKLLARQWAQLWNIHSEPVVSKNDRYILTQWYNSEQDAAVQLVEVIGLGHGIMVNPNEENGGEVTDYLLASSISTVKQVIKFWQLSEKPTKNNKTQ